MNNVLGRLLLIAALALPGPAALAQGTPESDRLRDGLGQFFDGLREGLDDSLDELRDLAELAGPALRSFLAEMGPALTELMDEVKDWSRYEPPVMLPNGDILIRRKPDPPPAAPEPDAPDGSIEI